MNQKFPRVEHLKRKKLIESLFSEGSSLKAYPLRLVFIETKLSEPHVAIQAGFSVAKRNHKLAVTRNKIKRLIREAYRLHKSEFITNDSTYAFMFIYIGREVLPYGEIERAMHKLIRAFNKK